MSSSKKRSKGAPEEEPWAKRRPDTAGSPLVWTDAGVQVLLPGGERVVCHGAGVLTVHSGEIDVAGHTMSASCKPLRLDADEDFPVVIASVSAEARVPLAGTRGAAFSIDYPPPSSPAEGGKKLEGHHKSTGLQVYLETDPEAPKLVSEVPPAWRDGAASVAASVAAGLAAGAPPPVIAICGAKNVGKSSFARFLVNRLLNAHPVVAYLETGEGEGGRGGKEGGRID